MGLLPESFIGRPLKLPESLCYGGALRLCGVSVNHKQSVSALATAEDTFFMPGTSEDWTQMELRDSTSSGFDLNLPSRRKVKAHKPILLLSRCFAGCCWEFWVLKMPSVLKHTCGAGDQPKSAGSSNKTGKINNEWNSSGFYDTELSLLLPHTINGKRPQNVWRCPHLATRADSCYRHSPC